MAPTKLGSKVITGLTVTVLRTVVTVVDATFSVHWPLTRFAPVPGVLGPYHASPRSVIRVKPWAGRYAPKHALEPLKWPISISTDVIALAPPESVAEIVNV